MVRTQKAFILAGKLCEPRLSLETAADNSLHLSLEVFSEKVIPVRMGEFTVQMAVCNADL